MFYKRNFLLLMPLFALLLLVSGCGGSNSNSGGSTIIYVGVQQISVAQSRIVSEPKTTTFRIDRDGSQVTVVDRDFMASATLMADNFSVTSPVIDINVNGMACSYSITYAGTLTQSVVSGTLNGPLDCGLTAALSGEFEASAVAGDSSNVLPSVSALLTGN